MRRRDSQRVKDEEREREKERERKRDRKRERETEIRITLFCKIKTNHPNSEVLDKNGKHGYSLRRRTFSISSKVYFIMS